jgi:hypothetical protein
MKSGLEWQDPQVSGRFGLATLEAGSAEASSSWGDPWQDAQVAASAMPCFFARPWTLPA